MNWPAFVAMLKTTWQIWLQSRSFFFLLAFGWMIPPLVYLFVWSTVASDHTIGGMTQGEFISYYLLLILVNQLTYSQTNWTVGDSIRNGGLSLDLLRPVPPFYGTLASELAGKVVYMLFVVPVVLLLALILHPVLHPTLPGMLFFLPSLMLAWLLRFLWGYWLALLAFWATRADALLALQDSLIFLLAGQVAPVALLPGPLHTSAALLPFRYMLGFPVEVLIGHLNTTEMISSLLLQACWLLFALGLSMLLWRAGLRRYTAVGG